MKWPDTYNRDCECGHHTFNYPTLAEVIDGEMECPVCRHKYDIDAEDRNNLIAVLIANVDRLELAVARLEARVTRLESPFAGLGL